MGYGRRSSRRTPRGRSTAQPMLSSLARYVRAARRAPLMAASSFDSRWSFASGIQHCAWWNAGCVVHDAGGPRQSASGELETCLVFFPATAGELIDTWDVGGL